MLYNYTKSYKSHASATLFFVSKQVFSTGIDKVFKHYTQTFAHSFIFHSGHCRMIAITNAVWLLCGHKGGMSNHQGYFIAIGLCLGNCLSM